MLVSVLNTILFITVFLMHIASRICNRFLLLFIYIIIVLSARIFFTSEDVSWLVLLLCFEIMLFYGAISRKVISKMTSKLFFQRNVLKQNAENVPTDNFKIKRSNKLKEKNINSQLKTTLPRKKYAWAEHMGQFLYHLDPTQEKLLGVLKK